MPAPMGEVTVIVPVDTRQVGWMDVTTGDAGVSGWLLTVASVIGDIQPSKFFAVTLYVPGNTKLNTGFDW